MLFARPSTLRDATLLAITAAAVGSASSAVGAPSDQTTGTAVKASVKYADGSKNKLPVWTDIRVTIVRDGQRIITDQPLPAAANTSYHAAPKITAVDLDSDAEPEVVVDVFTSNTDREHRTAILRKDGGAYRADLSDWGTSGYRLANVVGNDAPEFLSSDSRISDLYKSDARGPLRVLAYDDGKLDDVSRKAHAELLRDAKRHRRALAKARRTHADPRPEIAAYAVDLVRLGREAQAQAAIRSASRKELAGSRKAFARRLDRVMVRWGYAKRKVIAGGV